MTLHPGKFHSGKSGQFGQAMTEMVIAASFVLIPLLLLIPWLGKYIDLHQSAIQAARYEAWEYTVWYNDVATEAPAGAVDGSGSQITMPEKSIAELQAEARQRFFSREAYANIPTTEANDESDLIGEGNWDIADANPLWQDHLGNSLLANTTTIDSTLESFDVTPNNNTSNSLDTPLKIDELVFNAANNAGGAIANLIAGATPTFEIHNLKGYSHTQMTIPIVSQPGLISFGTISGSFAIGATQQTFIIPVNTRAAVLSDGWNAGGRYHAKDQVGEITIARKLGSLSDKFTALSEYGALRSVPHMHPSWVTATGEFADLLECGDDRWDGWGPRSVPDVFGQGGVPADDNDGSLWTGYVDMGAIHPDRLHKIASSDYTVEANPIGGHNCPNNSCKFTYSDSYQYPWADPAVDDHLVAPDDCIK